MVFLFQTIAKALKEDLPQQQAKDLIRAMVIQRFPRADEIASFDWENLERKDDGFHLLHKGQNREFVFYKNIDPEPGRHVMKIELEEGNFVAVDILPAEDRATARFGEEDVKYYITDIDSLPEGLNMDDLSAEELHLLLKSPYEDIREASLDRLPEKATLRSLDILEEEIRSLNIEIQRTEKNRTSFIEGTSMEMRGDLGFLIGSLADECRAFRSEKNSLRRKIKRLKQYTESIRKRLGIESPEKHSHTKGVQWAYPAEEVPKDIERFREDSFEWSDFEQTGVYYAEKDSDIDLGYGKEDVIYLRRHKILVHKRTGRKYFTSTFPPNHIFAMAAGSMFYELLGLPVRQARVVIDDNGESVLIRERIEEGCTFNQYSDKYLDQLNFSQRWLSVLRGSLLLDQIIGYTDRDDTNLFAAVNDEGELVPVFVDMKFSFGNPKLVSVTEEHPDNQITYDFSRFITPFEEGALPEGFAYNEYHANATYTDMLRMARLVMKVCPEQVDEIVDLMDAKVKGHSFDVERLKAEWKKSLERVKLFYASRETGAKGDDIIFGDANDAWGEMFDPYLWGSFSSFRKRFIFPLYDGLEGLGSECDQLKERASRSIVLYADDMLNDTVIFDLEEALNLLIKEKDILQGGKVVLYSRGLATAESLETLRSFMEQALCGTEVLLIKCGDYPKLSARNMDQVGEMEELLELLPAKGVDTERLLAVVKSHRGGCVGSFGQYKLPVPLVMLNLNSIHEGHKGVFSLSDILRKAINRVNSNDPASSTGWIIIVDPMDRITIQMHEEYLIYRKQVLIKA
ncbi:MAG: hypothetical protein GF409_01385 [Candidatus Omnitrophica bacterium]|nr:hypothetical protein [Candidatus Omnitrophota bacterium]